MRFGIAKDGKTEWFAWRPVRLHNGQWLWLEKVKVWDYFNNRLPVKVERSLFTNRVFYPLGEEP